MHFLPTLATAFLVALTTPHAIATDAIVEPQAVNVTSFYKSVVLTAVADKRNYANPNNQPICVTDVRRVREAVYNNTRDMYIEVHGCAVETPRGSCEGLDCRALPFEVNVVGPATPIGFDLESVTQQGKAPKSPFTIRSIGILL